MTQPPEPQAPNPTEEPEPRLLWQAPRLTRFGNVSDATQGLSYRPLDGISNLTP